MRAPALLAALAASLLAAGCGYYSFSPAVQKGGIGTVAIPVLGNESLEYGIETDVTEALNETFTEDGGLRVVAEDEADALLRGAVGLYERAVMSDDAEGGPSPRRRVRNRPDSRRPQNYHKY